MTDPIDDQIASLRASSDQAAAASVDLARTMCAFRKALVEGGMSEPTAESMTMHWFCNLLSGAHA